MTTENNRMWVEMLSRKPEHINALRELCLAVYLLYGRGTFEFKWLTKYSLYEAIPFSVRDLLDADYLASTSSIHQLRLTDKGIALAQEEV